MVRHTFHPALMLVAVAVIAAPAQADENARLKAEAVAVLRAATALETYTGQETSPCRIVAEWSKETVPFDIARRVFGLKLRADLAAGSPVPDSYAILSAVEPDPSRLCSTGDLGRQFKAAQIALPSGTRFSYHVASYTFPVFDPAFSKAVVVWTALSSSRPLGGDDGKAGGVGLTVTALTFVKRAKGWALVAQDVVGQT